MDMRFLHCLVKRDLRDSLTKVSEATNQPITALVDLSIRLMEEDPPDEVERGPHKRGEACKVLHVRISKRRKDQIRRLQQTLGDVSITNVMEAAIGKLLVDDRIQRVIDAHRGLNDGE